MMKMRTKIFSPVVLASVIILFIYIFSLDVNNPFLSSLRFKEYKEIKNVHYDMEVINSGDTLFFHRLGFSIGTFHRTITWFGDTLVTIPSLRSGQYMPKEINDVFSGYDSTVIKFTKKKIIPIRQGRTQLFINYPEGKDTINVKVKEKENKLIVETEKD